MSVSWDAPSWPSLWLQGRRALTRCLAGHPRLLHLRFTAKVLSPGRAQGQCWAPSSRPGGSGRRCQGPPPTCGAAAPWTPGCGCHSRGRCPEGPGAAAALGSAGNHLISVWISALFSAAPGLAGPSPPAAPAPRAWGLRPGKCPPNPTGHGGPGARELRLQKQQFNQGRKHASSLCLSQFGKWRKLISRGPRGNKRKQALE